MGAHLNPRPCIRTRTLELLGPRGSSWIGSALGGARRGFLTVLAARLRPLQVSPASGARRSRLQAHVRRMARRRDDRYWQAPNCFRVAG